jgi:hypothetical protein
MKVNGLSQERAQASYSLDLDFQWLVDSFKILIFMWGRSIDQKADYDKRPYKVKMLNPIMCNLLHAFIL